MFSWRNWPFSISLGPVLHSENPRHIRSEKTAKTKTKTGAKMSGPTLASTLPCTTLCLNFALHDTLPRLCLVRPFASTLPRVEALDFALYDTSPRLCLARPFASTLPWTTLCLNFALHDTLPRLCLVRPFASTLPCTTLCLPFGPAVPHKPLRSGAPGSGLRAS